MQIKFRQAINNPDGSFKEWHYWGFGVGLEDEFTTPHSKYRENPSQQFINTCDADGKEIYQGDYVQTPLGNILIVDWEESGMRWVVRTRDIFMSLSPKNVTIKIVGNNTEGIKI